MTLHSSSERRNKELRGVREKEQVLGDLAASPPTCYLGFPQCTQMRLLSPQCSHSLKTSGQSGQLQIPIRVCDETSRGVIAGIHGDSLCFSQPLFKIFVKKRVTTTPKQNVQS